MYRGEHSSSLKYLNCRNKQKVLSSFSVPVERESLIDLSMAQFTVCPGVIEIKILIRETEKEKEREREREKEKERERERTSR